MAPRPVLILLHGTWSDAVSWRGYAELIPEADLVTPDFPGHGLRAGESWTLDEAMRVIDDAVQTAREQGRPVVLAGHSLGGYMALSYAEHHSDELGALVMIASSGDPSRHPRVAGLYRQLARLAAKVDPKLVDRARTLALRAQGVAPPPPDSAGHAVMPDEWEAVLDQASAQQLRTVTCPVFLVVGALDQMRLDVRAYAAEHPEVSVHVVPWATHALPVTHRRQVAAVLRDAVDLAALEAASQER